MAYMGFQLSLGTIGRIGPGFFPTGLGLLFLLFALLATFERDEVNFPKRGIRALVLISLAILAFALTVERLGLIVGVASVVILTAVAHGKPNPISIAGATIFLSALGFLLFVYLLRIPLSPLP